MRRLAGMLTLTIRWSRLAIAGLLFLCMREQNADSPGALISFANRLYVNFAPDFTRKPVITEKFIGDFAINV